MPKNKKRLSSDEDSSSSDSGPDDRNPPAKKAKEESPAKTDKSRKSSSSKGESSGSSDRKTNADGDQQFQLDRNRFVTVREFRGKVLVDIREYYQDSNGDQKPGKKGISLSAQQWGKLKSLMEDIDDAVKEK